MRVKQVPYYNETEQYIIVDEPEAVLSLSKLQEILVLKFSALKTRELDGIDQLYIDFKIEDNLVILGWDSMAGISIECENPELREKIFKHLQSI